jgi:hypothetical protein
MGLRYWGIGFLAAGALVLDRLMGHLGSGYSRTPEPRIPIPRQSNRARKNAGIIVKTALLGGASVL